jgi:hypothetical protein
MTPRAPFLSGPRLLDEVGALPSASPFTHVSINRGGGGSLADRRNLLKKRVFSLSAVVLSVSDGAEGLRSDGVSAGELVVSSSPISSPCVPIEYRLPYRRQTDNTYIVS